MRYSILLFFLTCTFYWSCDQSSPSFSETTTAAAAADIAPKVPEKSISDGERMERGDIKYKHLKKPVAAIIDAQKEWANKGFGYKREVQWGENSGTVYFYDGRLAKVNIYHPEIDAQLGMNGQCYCNYDEEGKLQLITTTSHGNNWAISNYYYKNEENFIGFSIQEDFSYSTPENKSEQKEIPTVDALHFSVELNNLDLYEKCNSIVPLFVELALIDDNLLNGTRYFTGQIDSQYTIQAKLDLYNNFIYGEYHYDQSSTSLSLSGNLEHGLFHLKESNRKTNETTGSFEGKITTDNKLVGTWISADSSQQLPFYLQLTEEYHTADGHTLLATQFAKSISERTFIKTHYFDLPSDLREDANNYLKTGDFSLLEANGEGIGYLLEKMESNFVYDNKYQKLGFDMHEDSHLSQRYFATVYNNLPAFVSPKERHQGYYANEQQSDFYGQLLSYFVYRIDRSPDNIQRIWDALGSTLMNRIDRALYTELHIKKWLDLHLATYEHLRSQPNYKTQLTNAYNQLQREHSNDHSIYDQAEFLSPLMENDPYESDSSLTAYSFWMRRHHEGNADVVAQILKEASAHFGQNTSSKED